MKKEFYQIIQEINKSKTPLLIAWTKSCQYLNIGKESSDTSQDIRTLNKNANFDIKHKNQDPDYFIKIITDYENLFVNRNSYHNEYHLAETVWTVAYLCKEEFEVYELYDHALLLMLAATFHDAEHTGKGNKVPFEMERVSANFFRKWWINNSLFLENVLTVNDSIMEQLIIDLILFTDFNNGQDKVLKDYEKFKDYSYYGFKIASMKKILNEADMLLTCLPKYALDKTKRLVNETGMKVSHEILLDVLIKHLESFGKSYFNSRASQKLDILNMIDNFYIYLSQYSHKMKKSHLEIKLEDLQILIDKKFK